MSHFFRFTYKKIVSLTQRINNTALGRRKMATQGLQKIRVIPNKNYRRSGTKSYVWLMNKWGFDPTMPGPYFMMNKIVQQGHPGVYPRWEAMHNRSGSWLSRLDQHRDRLGRLRQKTSKMTRCIYAKSRSAPHRRKPCLTLTLGLQISG